MTEPEAATASVLFAIPVALIQEPRFVAPELFCGTMRFGSQHGNGYGIMIGRRARRTVGRVGGSRRETPTITV